MLRDVAFDIRPLLRLVTWGERHRFFGQRYLIARRELTAKLVRVNEEVIQRIDIRLFTSLMCPVKQAIECRISRALSAPGLWYEAPLEVVRPVDLDTFPFLPAGEGRLDGFWFRRIRIILKRRRGCCAGLPTRVKTQI